MVSASAEDIIGLVGVVVLRAVCVVGAFSGVQGDSEWGLVPVLPVPTVFALVSFWAGLLEGYLYCGRGMHGNNAMQL
jgi:hypothetical protein